VIGAFPPERAAGPRRRPWRRWWLAMAALTALAAFPAGAQDPAQPHEMDLPPEEAAPEAAPPTPGTPAPPVSSDPVLRPDEAAGPPAGPIEFTVPFPEDQGGGTATGSAGALDVVQNDTEERYVLDDGVEIRYQDLVVTARRAEVDARTKVVTAEGDVVLDQGPRRLAGDTLTFDLGTKTGTLTHASAYVSPGYIMQGEEISKVGEDVYTLTDGSFTSCEQEVPAWSFKLGRARVRVDGYAKVKNASMRVKKVPVFYLPYILWPVKEERTSGFLLPQPGYSSRRGPSLSLAYYQTLGRSYDTTVEVDLYGEEYFGLGNEFRYRPTDQTTGNLVAYVISDPEAEAGEDDVRWKVDWQHRTRDLPFGLRGVVDFQDFSDFDFFREFERDFNQTSLRFLDSRGYVSGNWGPQSLNILVNQRETFITADRTVTLSKLPEIEYRLRPTKLGPTPLYLTVDSSLDYLSLDRNESYRGDYFRGNLFPQLTLPLRVAPWLNVSLSAGERFTYYGDSLRTDAELLELPAEERDRFRGETLTRAVPFAGAEVVGPSFSRIFEGSARRFKHVIEPRFTYTFADAFDDQIRIPIFDEVDGLTSDHIGRVSLSNRILAKPVAREGEEDAPAGGGSAREMLLFELSQAFSFDEDRPLQRGNVLDVIDGIETTRPVTRSAGPIVALLRYNPRETLSLKTQVNYNTLFSEIESTQVSGFVGRGVNTLGLTWFTRTLPDVSETVGNQVRLTGSVGILPNRLRVQGQINYDLEQSLLQQQRYILDYTGSCYGLRFEVRDFTAGELRDTDFRLAVTLKNVGTFLDLTGGFSNRDEL
jgi:LPS-assembly protein